MKNQWEIFQSSESNLGEQWLSRTGQIKICQDFCRGKNFDWFFIEPVGKTEMWPLWSTAAGDKEVVWLQKN